MDPSNNLEKNVVEVIESQSVPDAMNSEVQKANENSLNNTNTNINDDDSLDIDLSDLEIASCDNDGLNNPEFVVSDNVNETYKNIITVCSSTTQNIKKSISDFLSSRENVVIEEVDPTAELQESLNKKIADFEKVVSGCFTQPNSQDNSEGKVEECEKSVSQTEKKVTEKSEKNHTDSETECNKNKTKSKHTTESPEDKKVIELIENKEDKKLPLNSKIQSSTKEVSKSTTVEDDSSSKKQKQSSKKKGEKTVDQILKSLKAGTDEEKLQGLCKRHLESLEELRMSEQKVKQFERQIISQQREKEQLQADHNRMILAKSRLEGLCREMQRQSKAIKEESLQRIKEEEEKRKEVANKFQTTLNDIIALNQEVSKKNLQLREENAELATKLKSLVDNYEVWEKNMSKIIQQKELEAQLAKAKHAKVNLLLKQETEKFLREKQSLLENLSELQKRCTLLTTNELQLRTELGDYTSKYEEFQNVLSNSSKVFASFKSDMESTSKKIKKLEKETNVYKQKWEGSNKALLEMISHKEKQDKEFQNAQQRIQTLEKLCRALQAERKELRNQINVISSSSSTTQPEVPETGSA